MPYHTILLHTYHYIHTITYIPLLTYHCIHTITYIPSHTYHHIHTITYIPSHTYHHIHTITYIPSHTYHHIHTITYIPSHTYHHIHTITYIPSHTYHHTHTITYIPSHTYHHIHTITYHYIPLHWICVLNSRQSLGSDHHFPIRSLPSSHYLGLSQKWSKSIGSSFSHWKKRKCILHMSLAISGTDWLEVPTIYKAYVRAM